MGNIDTNGNGNVSVSGAIVTRFFQGKAEQRAQRERHAMLELVRATWVEGVLEKSLYAEILIRLGLKEQPGAGERPWDMLLQTPDQPNRMLPPGTPLVEVFDAVNGSLLILGEPGAGKTTMLLELARDTIARAGQDAALPIPVVFNLSSWTDPQQSLADWLVAELRAKYYAPKATAPRWVEHDELLLLLDGLDEVRPENREACIQAINDFRQGHMTMPLVVCCRTADYKVLGTKLQLQGTVILQPLTSQQVKAYFDRMGEKLATVRQAWKQDSVLQELVRQPLMLNILTLAYQGLSVEELASMHGTLETRRKHLFDTYIRRMATRPSRTSNPRYTPEQTTRWLAWLAQKMSEQGQSIFLLEQMRRRWLQAGTQQYLHKIGAGLAVGLTVGLGVELVQWLLNNEPGVGLIVGLLAGLGGLFLGLSKQGIEEATESLKWSWEKALNVGLGSKLFWLLVSLLILRLVDTARRPTIWQKIASGTVLVAVLGGGLLAMLSNGLTSAEIGIRTVPNQGIRQSIKNTMLVWLVIGVGGGLGIGLVIEVVWWLVDLSGRLGSGLSGGIAIGLVIEWARWLVELVGLVIEVPHWLVGLDTGIGSGLSVGLNGGLCGGLIAGLMNGGTAVISHYALRFLLCCQGHMPWNYVRFLDYAAKRLFLREVGGGYIFVHRLVMEHFASLSPNS